MTARSPAPSGHASASLPISQPEPSSVAQSSGGTLARLATTTVALERASDGAVPPLGPVLSPGTQVGRYRVVELLGTGGGGSVYRAHDPHLSRDVALKVLHRRDDPQTSDREYRRRLLREAKTLAKLSHPNVVAAYDVGTLGDSVFVAMELVPGESLRVWLQREKHSREEILRVLIAIGRGLIAAHAAGVMHRDIKPANVMVAPDGSVRIVDFGLARSLRSPAEANEPATTDGDRAATFAALTSEMTDTALLSGTPGYIAPEILRGDGVIDAQADQFSYAVTVFLALTGKRPYDGNTLSEYMAALARNERAPWPRSIPRRIRRVVERGLECRNEDRHPSVRVLVDALEKASAPSRRAPAFAAVGLGALALAAAALVVKERATRETCRVDAAAFAGVWDAERRAALERALVASGRFNAAEAFGLLAARLDTFERNWLVMKQDSCQATHVRAEQSERVLALRNGCLIRKLEGVKALVQAFSEPDPRAADRAAAATPDLLDECADTATLLGLADKLPADPEVQKAIGEVESGMVVTRALMTAGRNAAIDHGRQVLESARRIGHEPTIAQAVSSLAHAISVSASNAEEHKQGEEMLRESMRLAAKVGDDRMLAKTAAHLFVVLAYGQRRVQEADAMLPMVEALVSLTGNDSEQKLEVLMGRGMILSQRRKYREATEVFDQVIQLSPSVESDRRGYGAYANGEIGKMDLDNHRYPEAVRRFEAELAGIRKELGARHPRVVFSLVNLALAQSKAELRDAAWATVAQIRDLVSHLYPPGDWRYVAISFVEGNIWEDAGDCPRALPAYREAFRTIEATYGPSHSNTADVRARLGTCLHAVGQLGEATVHLERVLEIRTEIGAAPNVIAEAAFELADVFWSGSSTQRSRAIALAEQALSLWRQDQVSERAREAEEWLARRRPSRTPSAPRKTSPVAHQGR